jgi:hypothetical protein
MVALGATEHGSQSTELARALMADSSGCGGED